MHSANHEKRIHEFCVVALKELEIDPDGTIWRVARRRRPDQKRFDVPRKRAEYPTRKGYLQIRVKIDGKILSTGAHRLVWYHFFGEIPPGLTVNHKGQPGSGGGDKANKANNHPDNLELATDKEQRRHALDVLKVAIARGEGHGMSKLTEADVLEIRRRRAAGEDFQTIADAFGLSKSNAFDVSRGRIWQHVGGELAATKPKCKLTADDVLEIRRRVAAGESQKDVAAAFGVGRPVLSQIVSRQRWRHI